MTFTSSSRTESVVVVSLSNLRHVIWVLNFGVAEEPVEVDLSVEVKVEMVRIVNEVMRRVLEVFVVEVHVREKDLQFVPQKVVA